MKREERLVGKPQQKPKACSSSLSLSTPTFRISWVTHKIDLCSHHAQRMTIAHHLKVEVFRGFAVINLKIHKKQRIHLVSQSHVSLVFLHHTSFSCCIYCSHFFPDAASHPKKGVLLCWRQRDVLVYGRTIAAVKRKETDRRQFTACLFSV